MMTTHAKSWRIRRKTTMYAPPRTTIRPRVATSTAIGDLVESTDGPRSGGSLVGARGPGPPWDD